ncbi:MAG TPA: RNA polymerase subunit sigma-70, partial [Solibacterales bacterium]|nr:RNA polymerase subunit sigma-70 [Bryobacterales bacterium]
FMIELASSIMKQERGNHTLQPTALVHEAYVRLFGGGDVAWQSRSHFFAVAARQMRRILVDHARAVQAEKRGGEAVRLSLDDANQAGAVAFDEDVLAVDEALSRLEQIDARAAKVVEFRYFGGLTEPETAEALGIGISTMKRDWDFARSWLFDQLVSRKDAGG